MIYKSALFTLLAGLFYFPAIIALDISPDDREEYSVKFTVDAYEPCKHLISEETYDILADGSYIDNDESRRYYGCMFISRKWLVNKKLNVDLMISDVAKIRGKPFSPAELIGAKVVMNLCKKEGENESDDDAIVFEFGKCIHTRCLTDL